MSEGGICAAAVVMQAVAATAQGVAGPLVMGLGCGS